MLARELWVSWAKEALRGSGGRGGAARECVVYADLRLGVDTMFWDLRRARDELLGRSFGVVDLEGKVEVVVDVAEGILGGGEAQLGPLFRCTGVRSGRVSFVYTQAASGNKWDSLCSRGDQLPAFILLGLLTTRLFSSRPFRCR